MSRFRRIAVASLMILAGAGGIATAVGFAVAIMYFGIKQAGHTSGDSDTDTGTAAPDTSGQRDLYGTIEIGSKGTKANVWEIPPARLKDLTVVNQYGTGIKYPAFDRSRTRFPDFNTLATDPANIGIVTDHVASFVNQMRQSKVPASQIYIVASSGVAERPVLASLRSSIERRTHLTVDAIDVKIECRFAYDWLVLPRYALQTVLVDIGSGNVKACYAEREDDMDGIRWVELLATGTSTFAEAVEAARKPGESFADASARLRQTLAQHIDKLVDANAGLINRPRLCLIGGISWITAMLRHPGDSAPAVRFAVPADFERLRQQLADRARRPLEVDTVATPDGKVENPFTPNQMIAGLDILLAIADRLDAQRSGKFVYFAQPSKDAWMGRYLMSKVANSRS